MADNPLETLMAATNGEAKAPPRIQIEQPHPDEATLPDSDRPTEPPESFALSLDARETPFSIEGDFYLKTASGTKKLRIRSVDGDVIEKEVAQLRPPQPKVNGRDGQRITDEVELQERFPAYRQAMEQFNTEAGYSYILHGTLGLELRDKQGEVVWSPDESKRDRKKASQALRDMKLSRTAWVDWYLAIRDLSKAQMEDESQDFLSDSAGTSGYL